MKDNSCIRQQADPNQIERCQRHIDELDTAFEDLSNGLALVGNLVRLKILYLLQAEKRLCVCDLSDILGMKISAVSQHLRKLKDRKLIQSDKEAQTIYYSVTARYLRILAPFFRLLKDNKILEIV